MIPQNAEFFHRHVSVIPFVVTLTLMAIWLKLEISGPAIDLFCLGLAIITEWVVIAFGADVLRIDHALAFTSSGAGIIVDRSCSGLSYFIVALAFALTSHQSRLRRLKFVLVFFMLTQAGNVIRIVSLLYAKVYVASGSYNLIHEQLWPLATLLISALLLLDFITDQRPHPTHFIEREVNA